MSYRSSRFDHLGGALVVDAAPNRHVMDPLAPITASLRQRPNSTTSRWSDPQQMRGSQRLETHRPAS